MLQLVQCKVPVWCYESLWVCSTAKMMFFCYSHEQRLLMPLHAPPRTLKTMGFIRAVRWSAQNAESHCSHVRITVTVKHINFHAFYVWVSARLMSCLNCLALQRQAFYSTLLLFEKGKNLFNSTGQYTCSLTLTQNSVDMFLPGAKKKFGQKRKYFMKWVSMCFYCWLVEDVSSPALIGPCIHTLAHACIPS